MFRLQVVKVKSALPALKKKEERNAIPSFVVGVQSFAVGHYGGAKSEISLD